MSPTAAQSSEAALPPGLEEHIYRGSWIKHVSSPILISSAFAFAAIVLLSLSFLFADTFSPLVLFGMIRKESDLSTSFSSSPSSLLPPMVSLYEGKRDDGFSRRGLAIAPSFFFPSTR